MKIFTLVLFKTFIFCSKCWNFYFKNNTFFQKFANFLTFDPLYVYCAPNFKQLPPPLLLNSDSDKIPFANGANAPLP